MKKIGVGLLGLGTVGMGTYQVLKSQQAEMLQKLGVELEIRRIAVKDPNEVISQVEEKDTGILTSDWREVVQDDSVEIVIELMGGLEPAKTCILAALRAGKHVVTANKDLVAVAGRELLDAASEHKCDFLFEAAVAGGIPIIRPMKQCLLGNNITEIMGIVNGTTNFILTKMEQEGMEFQEALDLATELGYAEADPTADIEGLDAGRKVAIMASIGFHSRVVFDDVHIEGITKITAKDIQYAKEMGCTIKLLGVACCDEEGIEAYVCPMLISDGHPLASVNDSYNAVFLHGDAVENVMFFGRGAGSLPTASAVVGDVFDIARNIQNNCCGRISCSCYKELPIKKMEDTKNSFFLRMLVEDKCGVFTDTASAFAQNQVSLAQIIQRQAPEGTAELVVITDSVREGDLEKAINTLKAQKTIKEIASVLRVYKADKGDVE